MGSQGSKKTKTMIRLCRCADRSESSLQPTHMTHASLYMKSGFNVLLSTYIEHFQLMRGSRQFCQRGSNFDNVFFFSFLVDEGRKDPNTTISGPSWRFAGVPMLAQH